MGQLYSTGRDEANMNPKTLLFSVVVLLGIVATRAARMFILDEQDLPAHYRVRRQSDELEPISNRRNPVYESIPPAVYDPIPPAVYDPIPPNDLLTAGSDSYGHHGGYKHGIVGPVYTFVKTDPYAHVKWGVRHVAGKKYAHGGGRR